MAGDEPNIGGFLMLPFAGGETIYKWFEKGKGPSQSTTPTAEGWRGLSDGHTDVATLINKAVRDSGAAWEGQAGDAARSGTSPLATWADVTGESATSAATTSDQVGEAFVNAKHAMSNPPSVPDKPFLNDLAFWETDYDEAVEKNQQVSEANMRAFTQYGETVTASANNMPTFIAPDGGHVTIEENGGDPPIGPVKPLPHKPGGGDPPGGDGDGDQRNLTGGDDDTSVSGWKPPGDDTNTSGVNDPKFPPSPPPPPNDDWRNRPPPGGDPNIPPGGRWNPNDPNDPRNRPGGPNDPRNRPGGPNGPGGRGTGGPGGGGGGAGGGRGGGGGGLGGAAAARGAGGIGGPGAMGSGSGFGGASGVAGEGRGGAGGFGPTGGAAGAAGRGGAAGMGAGGMGAGAGKGEGDEDKEHKSASYLQETEDIFGDGTMVAPPVIGG
ncbi:PPE domain-containing protein [Lentzea sp. NPDC054927]